MITEGRNTDKGGFRSLILLFEGLRKEFFCQADGVEAHKVDLVKEQEREK